MFTYILLQFLPKYTHPCPALYCKEKKICGDEGKNFEESEK
jgi:hypothetical protein